MTKKRKKGSPRRKEDAAKPRPAQRLEARTSLGRGEFKYLAVIFAVSLALRLVYFFLNRNNNPLFYHPVLDALFHHEWALEINSGNFWGNEVFFRAPLYPYLLAFVYKLGGNNIAAAVFVQHLLGAFTPVLVYVLARFYFAPVVAIVAGVFAAVYWPLIFFEGELLIVTLIVSLDLVLLILVVMAMRSGSGALYFASGLVLGLSAIARPSILILLPVLPLVMRFTVKRHGRYRGLLPIALGLAVVVAPVIVRNYVVGRDIVPIAAQGGVNFYIGNNPQANGSAAVVPGVRADLHGTYRGAIELAENAVGRPLKPSEVSNYYMRKGLRFMADSPAQAAGLLLKKTYLFWGGAERSNSKYLEFFWNRFGFGRLWLPGFWLLGPLALLGGVVVWRRRAELSLLYLFVASYMVGVVLFFVNARFRLPVAPVLAIFAGYAIVYVYGLARGRSTELWRILPALVVFALFVNLDFLRFRGVRSYDVAVSHYELGRAHLKQGNRAAALVELQSARRTYERHPHPGYRQIAGNVDYYLGELYWEDGRYNEAVVPLGRIAGDNILSVRARNMLADSFVHLGRPQRAVAVYKVNLDVESADSRVHEAQKTSYLGIAGALEQLGSLEEAIALLEEAARRYPGDPEVETSLARLREGTSD